MQGSGLGRAHTPPASCPCCLPQHDPRAAAYHLAAASTSTVVTAVSSLMPACFLGGQGELVGSGFCPSSAQKTCLDVIATSCLVMLNGCGMAAIQRGRRKRGKDRWWARSRLFQTRACSNPLAVPKGGWLNIHPARCTSILEVRRCYVHRALAAQYNCRKHTQRHRTRNPRQYNMVNGT